MKRLSSILLALALTGCATTQTRLDPAVLQQAVDDGIGLYTALRLQKVPGSRVTFIKVRDALDNLVLHENWNASALTEALVEADVNAVNHSGLELYVMPGISLITILFNGDKVDLASVPYSKAVIIGADRSLNRVLQ